MTIRVLLIGMVPARASPAAAQTVGGRAGVSIDPEQFYFGGRAETLPLIDRLHFRPNLEIGLGDETTIAAFNAEFAYQFRSPEAWNVYAGAGPALNIIDRGREMDAEPGFNLVVGWRTKMVCSRKSRWALLTALG
jgi:hypothetical protein